MNETPDDSPEVGLSGADLYFAIGCGVFGAFCVFAVGFVGLLAMSGDTAIAGGGEGAEALAVGSLCAGIVGLLPGGLIGCWVGERITQPVRQRVARRLRGWFWAARGKWVLDRVRDWGRRGRVRIRWDRDWSGRAPIGAPQGVSKITSRDNTTQEPR